MNILCVGSWCIPLPEAHVEQPGEAVDASERELFDEHAVLVSGVRHLSLPLGHRLFFFVPRTINAPKRREEL